MARFADLAINSLIPLVIVLHLIVSPYTKVEESFNLQATHDIQAFGLKLGSNETATHIATHFDHVEFPGSVPRTFTGALLLAGLTQPIVPFVGTAADAQILVRCLLGLLVAASLIFVRHGVDTAFGTTAGRWYVVFLTSQFHTMYYASRTLPNIFAFILTNGALALLLLADSISAKSVRGRQRRSAAIYFLTIAGVVFRAELSILLFATVATMLARSRASLTSTIIPSGLLGLFVGLCTTVSIDSILWQRWTWPELEGFYFNTILGKSADWGTSPFHYYFLNALPRLMLNPVTYLVCLSFAPGLKASGGISFDTLLPHVVFILIYSLMPHKEWRFIIYSIPAFTAVAAGGAAWIWNRRAKIAVYRWLALLLILSTGASYALSMALMLVSSLNYPGGEALRLLHQIETAPGQRVFLDNLACQTGVTRFLQVQPSWTYDKTENTTLLLTPTFWQQFDYVIAEDPKRVIGSWQIKDSVVGFAGITLHPDDTEEALPIGNSPSLGALARAHNAYARVMRTKLTQGRWPTLRLKRMLYILERERVGLKDDVKLTI